MVTFAEELVNRIREKPAFWSDFESLSSAAICRLLPGFEPTTAFDATTPCTRLLQTATILSQTASDSDKILAQNIAFFSALVSSDVEHRNLAKDVLYSLGNMPGADRLANEFQIGIGSFSSHMRHSLLRVLNTVKIDDQDFALTDFQHDVWSSMPDNLVGAISAPTSAGKSFLVIEHLCQQVEQKNLFVAVFIAPTRALIGEVYSKISTRLELAQDQCRISIIPTLDREKKAKQIFILTQERLQVLLSIWEGTIDLVVVDEAQAIGDDSRGMILQDCLEGFQTFSSTSIKN